MQKHIVMIHGMWASSWSFDNYRAYFEERGYQVHTPVLPHHGDDPDGDALAKYGIEEYTTYLVDWIDNLKLDSAPVVLGHSMGGLLAQKVASRIKAAALVCMCPAPPYGINALRFSVIRTFIGVLLKPAFWNKSHTMSESAAAYAIYNLAPDDSWKEKEFNRLGLESGKAIFEIGMWPVDFKRAARVDAKKVICPVLVVSGAEDRITPAAVNFANARKYKQAEYRSYPNHAHWIMGEPGWQDVARDVAEWLNRNTAA